MQVPALCRYLHGLPTILEGIDRISMDDYGKMKRMASMLIGQGQTRIAYI